MVIHLQVALAGTPLLQRQVKMKAPDGTTVEGLLELYGEKYGVSWAGKLGLSVLVNGTRGSFRQVLADRDRVKVFRPMVMG